MQMCEPYVAATEREVSAVETLQANGAFLAVVDLRPRFNDIHILPCLIKDLDRYRLFLVFHRDRCQCVVRALLCIHTGNRQFKVLVSIRMF